MLVLDGMMPSVHLITYNKGLKKDSNISTQYNLNFVIKLKYQLFFAVSFNNLDDNITETKSKSRNKNMKCDTSFIPTKSRHSSFVENVVNNIRLVMRDGVM